MAAELSSGEKRGESLNDLHSMSTCCSYRVRQAAISRGNKCVCANSRATHGCCNPKQIMQRAACYVAPSTRHKDK